QNDCLQANTPNVDPETIGGFRMLPDGLRIQAPGRAFQQKPEDGHEQIGKIDKRRLRKKSASHPWNVAQPGKSERCRGHMKLWHIARRSEGVLINETCHSESQNIEDNSSHDLVG